MFPYPFSETLFLKNFFINSLFLCLPLIIMGFDVKCIIYCLIYSSVKDYLHLTQLDKEIGNYAASIYVHGYLRKILPQEETSGHADFRERMENYIKQNELGENFFPIRKLFILIPASCSTKPLIGKHLDEGKKIIDRYNLPSSERNRAGVKDRVFTNSVYKIYNKYKGKKIENHEKIEDMHVSVVAEYASPLTSFYESKKDCKGSDCLITFSYNFYNELKNILDSLEMKNIKDSCELLYYDDVTRNYDEYDALVDKLKDSEVLSNAWYNKVDNDMELKDDCLYCESFTKHD